MKSQLEKVEDRLTKFEKSLVNPDSDNLLTMKDTLDSLTTRFSTIELKSETFDRKLKELDIQLETVQPNGNQQLHISRKMYTY